MFHYFIAPLLDTLFYAGNLPIGGEKTFSEGTYECRVRLYEVRSKFKGLQGQASNMSIGSRLSGG